MIDLRVTDCNKAEDEEGYVDFITLSNEQWGMVKAVINAIKAEKESHFEEGYRCCQDFAEAKMRELGIDYTQIFTCDKQNN